MTILLYAILIIFDSNPNNPVVISDSADRGRSIIRVNLTLDSKLCKKKISTICLKRQYTRHDIKSISDLA